MVIALTWCWLTRRQSRRPFGSARYLRHRQRRTRWCPWLCDEWPLSSRTFQLDRSVPARLCSGDRFADLDVNRSAPGEPVVRLKHRARPGSRWAPRRGSSRQPSGTRAESKGAHARDLRELAFGEHDERLPGASGDQACGVGGTLLVGCSLNELDADAAQELTEPGAASGVGRDDEDGGPGFRTRCSTTDGSGSTARSSACKSRRRRANGPIVSAAGGSLLEAGACGQDPRNGARGDGSLPADDRLLRTGGRRPGRSASVDQ